MTAVMAYPNFLIWRRSGVSSGLTSASNWLIRPSSVSLPVVTTTPVARPDTTIVPENAMHSRSPTVALPETASVFFSAGTDSPVSAASSVRRFFASTSRKSAGILSPNSSSTTSPGTSCSAGSMRVSPPRTVRASAESMLRIESSAFSALPSWMNPKSPLRTTTAKMIAASTHRLSISLVNPAPRRT